MLLIRDLFGLIFFNEANNPYLDELSSETPRLIVKMDR